MVAASVVVVVGVGTYETSSQFIAGWDRYTEVTYRGFNDGSECTDHQ